MIPCTEKSTFFLINKEKNIKSIYMLTQNINNVYSSFASFDIRYKNGLKGQ